MRVLLFGIHYSPELTGIGPYTTGLAEHLAARGCDVAVVAGLAHYPEWKRMPLPPPPAADANPQVRRYAHFIPRRPKASGRMLYEATWLASASRSLIGRRADVAIGVIPTLSGGGLAVMAGRRFKAPVGLIFQDLLGLAARQSGYQGGGRAAGAIQAVEGFLARRADQIAIISDGFRPYLEGIGVSPDRLTRVRNWSRVVDPTESVAQARARLGWADADFVCLHAGNMGQKQALDNLLEAARLITDPQVKIVLAGDGNDRDRLVAHARRLGLDNVSFLGLQPAGQFESTLRAADVLLLNQRGSMSDMALPSKLASYFRSGRPVLAAVASGSSTASEILEAQAGLVVDAENPEAVRDGIVALRESPAAAQRYGVQAMQWAERHLSRDQALAQYDVFLDKLIASRAI